MKASLLRNCPLESKKCWGLNTSGVSHSSLSNSTDESMALIAVPWVSRGNQALTPPHLDFLFSFFFLAFISCWAASPWEWSILPASHLYWPSWGTRRGRCFPIFGTHGWQPRCKACWACRPWRADETVQSPGLFLPGLSLWQDWMRYAFTTVLFLKLFCGICDRWTPDLEPPGSSIGTRGPSVKLWRLFLFRPQSGPRCKHLESRCWSRPAGPFLAATVDTKSVSSQSVSVGWWKERNKKPFYHRF